MEAPPPGDLHAKYQKLASEYSKLRVHVKVLKKGVLEEQAKSSELRDILKEKEKVFRRSELEIDSLSFRNQQLTRRVSVLQEELENLQLKLTKKSKGKNDDKSTGSTLPPLDSDLLQEELQKRIIENAQLASQLSDRVFEVSQLKATIEDYEKIISDNESKNKGEVARLKNKIQELQYWLDDKHKDRNNGTLNKENMPSCSQTASFNGDFTSEGGSLIGSEDAISSMDDIQLHEQVKTQLNNKDSPNMKMEYELLQMENETLKLELSKCTGTHRRSRGDGHDSGDFNNFSETTVDGLGRVTGLLGELESPFILADEVQEREERLKIYFRKKLTECKVEKEMCESKAQHYMKECESLRLRFEEMENDKHNNEQTLEIKHNTISRLEEELHSTTTNYEQQMCVLTEHVASLNDMLARQHEDIEQLKRRKK